MNEEKEFGEDPKYTGPILFMCPVGEVSEGQRSGDSDAAGISREPGSQVHSCSNSLLYLGPKQILSGYEGCRGQEG